MNEFILSISPRGYWVHFALFASLTVVVAIVIYTLLSSTKFRRRQFRKLGRLSKITSLLLVLPFAGAAIYYFYSEDWGYFFTLKPHEQTIEIGYYWPSRTIVLGRSDQLTVHTESSIRKSGLMYRLVIRAGNGAEYSSQLMNRNDLDDILVGIERRLGVKVGE